MISRCLYAIQINTLSYGVTSYHEGFNTCTVLMDCSLIKYRQNSFGRGSTDAQLIERCLIQAEQPGNAARAPSRYRVLTNGRH